MSTLATVETPIVITQYDVLLDDIKQAQHEAKDLPVFDYRTTAGNKAARSYVFGLRKLKSRIEAARKDAKAYALAYGKRVDEQARELADQVLDLIQPHQDQLDAIARAEAERVEALKAIHDHAIGLGLVPFGATSAMIQARIVMLDEIQLDQLQEYREPTAAAIVTSRQQLQVALAAALASEEQKRELDRLQAEKEEREARERNERIRQEAQEKADAEAQAAAADAIAEAEARAAAAEAQLAAAAAVAPIIPAADRSPTGPAVHQSQQLPPSPPGAAEAAESTRRRRLLAEQLQGALAGMNRQAVVSALVDGRLHPAISIDWGRVV